ncbi:hypothetical protein [Halomarina pelagica]|uniref:hypothetical protein n=1 Tax=Halomarina pelagica TaxID=2961599 RepID=UPI0020C43519|nr:hypothetical protein [Halomarina sp. BND7]
MIVEAFALYEAMLGIVATAGTLYLLYSGDFVVVHRRFLEIVAAGTGVAVLGQLAFLLYWPPGVQFAHLVLLLSLTLALYSLVTGYPTREKPWFATLFS